MRVSDLRVAVDVQHLYRPHKPHDQGSVFRLADGSTVTEGHAATMYAEAITAHLRGAGATVLTNPTLAGYYSARQRAASGWGAHLYLACHVNAGGGAYALIEHASDRQTPEALAGTRDIGRRICLALTDQVAGIVGCRQVELATGTRGRVCVEGFAGPHALLEPFFGDHPQHQPLLAAVRLKLIGEVLGSAVVNWWQFGHDGRDANSSP